MPIDIGRIQRKDSHFFLNSSEVPGLQDVRFDFSYSAAPLKHISLEEAEIYAQGRQIGGFSASYFTVAPDLFLGLTGAAGCNGYLVKSRQNVLENVGFTSGYLTSYNAKYAIGQLPQVDVELAVFGNLGRINNYESERTIQELGSVVSGKSNTALRIPGRGSIELNIDTFSTNRLLSYGLSINVARNPIYASDIVPIAVFTNGPIEVLCNFQIDVNDYVPAALADFPRFRRIKDLQLTIRDNKNQSVIQSYSFNNLNLLSQSMAAGIDGGLVANLTFRAFIRK